MAGDVIIGSFYNEELQKAYVTDDTVYKIEKVLKKRTYRGVKSMLNGYIIPENLILGLMHQVLRKSIPSEHGT